MIKWSGLRGLKNWSGESSGSGSENIILLENSENLTTEGAENLLLES